MSRPTHPTHWASNHTMSFLGPQKLKRIRWLSSCVSMAVGFGNVWRFPGVAYDNGGGAFFYVYILLCFLISRSLFFFEMSLGQFTGENNVGIWNIAPIFKGAFLGLIFFDRELVSRSYPFFFVFLFFFTSPCSFSLCSCSVVAKFQTPNTSLLVRTVKSVSLKIEPLQ